jgi:hypothetical protein
MAEKKEAKKEEKSGLKFPKSESKKKAKKGFGKGPKKEKE